MLGPVAGLEAREGAFETEGRIGTLRPARERQPMLDLFVAPSLDVGKGLLRAALEHADEIVDIGGRIVLDERGGLHRRKKARLDLCGIEIVPTDIVQRPAGPIDRSTGHSLPRCALFSNGIIPIRAPGQNAPWLHAFGQFPIKCHSPWLGSPVLAQRTQWIRKGCGASYARSARAYFFGVLCASSATTALKITAPREAGAGDRAARRPGRDRPHSSPNQDLPRCS